MKAIRPFVLLVALIALAIGLRPLLAQITPLLAPAAAPRPVSRVQADKDYSEKSYALALPEYQALLQTLSAKSSDQALLQYRIAVALGASQKWDDAVAAWAAFLPAHASNPLWSARAHYQRGLLLNQLPHQGYKVGTRIYRGNDYPHTSEAEKPEYVYLQDEDTKEALSDFETAVTEYAAVPSQSSVADEETDLYFDLARSLPHPNIGRYYYQNGPQWGSEDDWKAAKTTNWTIDTKLPYDPKWPLPKKVLYLLERIPTLNPANKHNATLAELARGLYIASYHNSWVKTAYVIPPGHPEKGHSQVVQSLPYFLLDPLAILTHAADANPNDPQAPQIRLIVAQWTDRAGGFVEALKLYRVLVARYPLSKWADDARQGAQSIQYPTVGLNSPGSQPAGKAASVSLNSRNLKTITLRAYQVPLETALSAPSKLEDPANRLTNFTPNFGSIDAAQKLGPKVAEWTQATGDKGDYAYYSTTLTTPLTKAGAYLVVAVGDDSKVRAATILLVTDLAVMKKMDKDNVLCFVADARSGRPVPGANVIIRQTWYDSSPHVQVGQGISDADGMVSVPSVKQKQNVQSEALATAPGERYALTGQGYWYDYGNSSDTRDEIKIYAYTDRPVYRPKQTVYFRQMLARRAGGGSDYAPLVGAQVHVTIGSPKGDSVYDKTLASSQFGTVNGSFDLPNGAALGEYRINADVVPATNNVYTTGGSTFRVEEYKRPEYEVKVTPSASQARFGDKVAATVQATYYSGPPVAGAHVSYKVFRSPFYSYFRFPQPYDWYYHADDGAYTNQNADQGELVTQGTGLTDAKGALAVAFTAEKGTRGFSGDYAYTVMADVVDSSRRQISGEGVLHVTNQAFNAYLNIPNGFYKRGDKVQVELRTQNADQQPVPVTGQLSVIRQTWDAGKTVETTVHTIDLTTDAGGKAFTTWLADESGSYRVEFKALDKFSQPVVANAGVWITGDDLNMRQFHTGGITLLTDKTTYEQGETAHLLIVSDQPDNWVLLTSETGNQVLTHTLVHVTGRAQTVDMPIVRADIPNFAFAAAAVRDYQFYKWQQEVFVPPTRQFLHMTVTGDKSEYKPGDTGTFHVAATDYLGHPAAAEVSLAVVDSSVFYIQKEYAPDIRLFYYGQRRNINVNLDSSEYGRVDAASENGTPVTQYNPHGIHLTEVGRLPGELEYPFYGYYGPIRLDYALPSGVARIYALQSNNSLKVSGEVNSIGGGGFGGGRASFSLGSVMYDGGSTDNFGTSTADVVVSEQQRFRSQPNNLYQGGGLLFGQPGGGLAPVQVRRNFSETAFWTPAVVTDKTTGMATLTVHFPDTLTTWKATARGLTPGVLVGSGDTQAITNKHLLVRLEAPRFFVERDQVTLSAIVRNDLATAKQVRVSLAAPGGVLEEPTPAQVPTLPKREGGEVKLTEAAETLRPPVSGGAGQSDLSRSKEVGSFIPQTITVPAHSEKRVDWTAHVAHDGQAMVRMTAETDEESDAVEQSFSALTYGVQKFLTTSGVLQADQSEAKLTIAIPKEHKAGSSALMVQINPSLAATTLDALPYLADYPYGCVEQTLDRFLPSVIVAHALTDAGVSLETLHQRALALQAHEDAGTPFGQAAPTTHSTDETGYTYPSGTPGVIKAALLSEGLNDAARRDNPVFDPEQLKQMTADGLSRLVSMQQNDGGWGWWGGSNGADAYLTSYVVYGLATAKSAGIAVPPDVLARGYAWLAKDIKDRDDDRNSEERDLAVWEAFALSSDPAAFPAPARHIVAMAYNTRNRLSAYGQSLLALTLQNLGDHEKAVIVCRNLRNTARIDTENGTASWKPVDRYWWYWYNNAVETDSWALKAYVAILPHDDLTPMLVKWLVQKQRGSRWNSTKETAMAVYALTDYIKANNELAPDYTIKVALGDKISRTYKITRDNALLFDNRFLVPDALLTGGDQTVTITKVGAGRLYYSSSLQYFTTEESIAGSGTELKVQRRYFRLTPKTKSVADYTGKFNVLDYTRTELADGSSVKSGDMIEVELVLDSKNEYDDCVFEDMKPAGCEPIDLRSGERYGDGLCSNMELRDTKTAFFIDHLPQGTRVLRYRLRAEVPGAFHALPTNGYAMYAPDVRALSDSWHVTVEEAEPETASVRNETIP